MPNIILIRWISVAHHPNHLSRNIAKNKSNLHVSFVWIFSCRHHSQSESNDIRICNAGSTCWCTGIEYDNEGNFCYNNRPDFRFVSINIFELIGRYKRNRFFFASHRLDSRLLPKLSSMLVCSKCFSCNCDNNMVDGDHFEAIQHIATENDSTTR